MTKSKAQQITCSNCGNKFHGLTACPPPKPPQKTMAKDTRKTAREILSQVAAVKAKLVAYRHGGEIDQKGYREAYAADATEAQAKTPGKIFTLHDAHYSPRCNAHERAMDMKRAQLTVALAVLEWTLGKRQIDLDAMVSA